MKVAIVRPSVPTSAGDKVDLGNSFPARMATFRPASRGR
jgi:hypothetical protein